jgi:hypothetical protein
MSSKEFGIEALNRFIPFSTPPLWGIVIFFARTCQNMTPIHAKVIAIEKRGGHFQVIVQIGSKYRGTFEQTFCGWYPACRHDAEGLAA